MLKEFLYPMPKDCTCRKTALLPKNVLPDVELLKIENKCETSLYSSHILLNHYAIERVHCIALSSFRQVRPYQVPPYVLLFLLVVK